MNVLVQQELALERKAPKVKPEEIERVVDILRAGGSWMTAAEIAMCDDSFNERRLRAIAEAAGSRILSWPGSPGYRLTSQATIEEVNHAVDALTSQSKKMIVLVVLPG